VLATETTSPKALRYAWRINADCLWAEVDFADLRLNGRRRDECFNEKPLTWRAQPHHRFSA
jgi:hypothetical protein